MSWINEYIYLVEKYAVIGTDLIDYANITTPKKLYIICYHIWNENKHPFIQFMLEKDTLSGELGLPFIEITSSTHDDIYKLIIKKIGSNLANSIQNIWSIKNVIYKGLINDSAERIYALVDITNVDIRQMHYIDSNSNPISPQSRTVFALPSEIINFGSVYNIKINENVKELFFDLPELGVLHDAHKKKPYSLPDAIYSGSFLENVVFSSFFGPSKKYIKSIGRSCFYFNIGFKNAFLDGGWVNDMFYTPEDVIDKNSRFKKYLKGGIIRYVLFPESFISIEANNNDIVITEDLINTLNTCKQIYIVKREDTKNEENEMNVVLLVRDHDSFVPLSYCEIDMKSIGDKYDINKLENYKLI
jgi:hypothetical protein